LKASYKSIDLDKRPDMDDIQDALEGITGARSVSLLTQLINTLI
jgi:glutaredoxin 3